MKDKQTVVVIGATNKPDRYSYKAVLSLKEHGHTVIPVNPALGSIEGIPVVSSLAQISSPVDTVTVYVGPKRSETMLDEIIALNPKRVIMNPGTESDFISEKLSSKGIEVLQACTLVMLGTDQF